MKFNEFKIKVSKHSSPCLKALFYVNVRWGGDNLATNRTGQKKNTQKTFRFIYHFHSISNVFHCKPL